MNIIDVTEQMMPDVERLFKKLYNEDVVAVLEECDAILAGGALTSLATNKEINDLDIYFKNKEGLVKFIKEVYNLYVPGSEDGDYILSSHDIIVGLMTDKSILCRDRKDNLIQVVAYKLFPSVEDVFQAFDFTVNMCAYDFKQQRVFAHPDFLKHCSQRYLKFNDGTHYPLMSALRVQKYLDRGFTISRSEMIRTLLTVANKKYESWEDVKKEMSGMYGIPVNQLFDEKKPFSLEEAVCQLSSVVTEGMEFKYEQPSYREIAAKFPQYFGEGEVPPVRGSFFDLL